MSNLEVKQLVAYRRFDGAVKPTTTSLQVAEYFGKEHFHVMRDIKDIMSKCSESFGASNFGCSSYVSEQGKELPMYLLTKDGFTMLAMGYTGAKAMEFKERYIAAFNEMERQLTGAALKSVGRMTPSYLAALRDFVTIDCGARGTQATRAIDRAWKNLEGVSPLALTGAVLKDDPEDDDYNYVTATTIANMFGISVRKLNDILTELGLQTATRKYKRVKTPDGKYERDAAGNIKQVPSGYDYMPTEEGHKYGQRKSDSAANDVHKEVWNLKWHKEKLPAYLKAHYFDTKEEN